MEKKQIRIIADKWIDSNVLGTREAYINAFVSGHELASKDLESKLAVAVEALEYYGNRMGSGGTARAALEKIKAK